MAFYVAFTHCYSLFLIFPALLGLCAWIYLGPYSTIYGGALGIWCIVFVEYWKIREADLSQRWGVNGVGRLKEIRTQFQWEKEFKDPVPGQAIRVFPRWKQSLRQLLLIPLASFASIALGGLICATFAGGVFISQVYNGPLHAYFEFVPTILFALSLPAITSFLTGMAARLTDYENHRTQGQYDLAQTQKAFLMNFTTTILPTLLTAYVYVPFAKSILPYLSILHRRGWNIDIARAHRNFQVDNSRFQQEVIILSMTAQALSLCKEIILPYAKHVLSQKWRTYRLHQTGLTHKPSVTKPTNLLRTDAPEEASFLQRVRNEAGTDEYKAEQNTLELCIQFGYLSLFGVSWPLLPLAFLLTNWLKLCGDIFKLTLASQRPPPLRTDSIGPCLTGLELLAWIGTLSTAAIAHIYRRPIPEVHLSSLLITIFLAEQVYLSIRFTAASVFKRIFADILHAEDTHRYTVRKSFLDARIARPGTPGSPGSGSRVSQRVRFHERVNVYSSSDASSSPDGSPALTSERSYDEALRGSDREAEFWNASLCDVADVGVEIIRALGGCQVELQDQMEWLKKG